MLNQILRISVMNLKMLPRRWASSTVTVFGVACVVAVFVGLFSIVEGFGKVMDTASDPDTLIVLGEGSSIESQSNLSSEDLAFVSNLEHVKRVSGNPLVSPEFLWMASLKKKLSTDEVEVAVRGVKPIAAGVRESFKVIEGRFFAEGVNEVVVGRRAKGIFEGIEVGSNIKMLGTNWTVVGIFETNGGINESELWMDLHNLINALPFEEWQMYQSARLKLNNIADLELYKSALEKNRYLKAYVQRESDYYQQFTKSLLDEMKYVVYPLLLLMGLGAVFAALNTMYGTIDARAKEMGTLRAIGFRTVPISVSMLIESILLALVGGLLGSGMVFLLLDGYGATTATANHQTQVEFALDVTFSLALVSTSFAVLIGLLGGILPAIRVGKMTLTDVLREA